jgi:serine phosphatase RsbU (regulator of sigma subunit)
MEARLRSAEVARQLGDALFEIQRHLGTALDSEEVVGLALGLACEALGATSGSIEHRELGGWVTSHVWGAAPLRIGAFLRDDQCPILGEISRTGHAVVVRDGGQQTRSTQSAVNSRRDPQASFPLTSRGRVVGALRFSRDRAGRVFSTDEAEFGRRLAVLLSMEHETRAQLRRHRRVAEAFQRALIDTPLALGGVDLGHIYAPASDADIAGGDFYDVFPLEDGRIAFSIGDVSGRGLTGATMTALVRDCIRVTTLDGLTPSAVLSKTNRILLVFGSPEMFATVLFGLLDVRTGVLTYAAGGCPPPVLMTRELRVSSVGDVDPLLGVLPDVHFEERQLTLAPGDRLVCFTNGIPEARSGDVLLEASGVERILQTSGRDDSRGLAQDLYEGALSFTGGTLKDDVAILIVGIRGQASAGGKEVPAGAAGSSK